MKLIYGFLWAHKLHSDKTFSLVTSDTVDQLNCSNRNQIQSHYILQLSDLVLRAHTLIMEKAQRKAYDCLAVEGRNRAAARKLGINLPMVLETN